MHSEWETKWKRRAVLLFVSSTVVVFAVTCVWSVLGSRSDEEKYGNLEASTVGVFFFILSFAFAYIAWSIPRLRSNEWSLAFIVQARDGGSMELIGRRSSVQAVTLCVRRPIPLFYCESAA